MKFGQLTYEMWRAVRLVVDPGMHSLGWTREQAIEFFKSNSSKSEHDIVVEIDRYIGPGAGVQARRAEAEGAARLRHEGTRPEVRRAALSRRSPAQRRDPAERAR
jgi:hypothetical protein